MPVWDLKEDTIFTPISIVTTEELTTLRQKVQELKEKSQRTASDFVEFVQIDHPQALAIKDL